ncbi:MAG: hypothetical protein QOF81_1109, partial [Acidimicrobiaceae bacterium]|nr:hypothetical protein [Acidimicrobiaceae bacterium]
SDRVGRLALQASLTEASHGTSQLPQHGDAQLSPFVAFQMTLPGSGAVARFIQEWIWPDDRPLVQLFQSTSMLREASIRR